MDGSQTYCMITQNTKKVIFLLPIWGGGGGEKVVSDLSFNLPGDIEKLVVVFKNKNCYPFNGAIISLNLSLSTNPFLKIFIFLRGYFKFKGIIRKEKPDYVISLGSLQNIINILSFKKSIVRVDNPIAISHRKVTEKLYPVFVRFLFSRAYKIIVVSNGLKKELTERFKIKEKNIDVIYNSIDIKKVQELAKEPLGGGFKSIFENPVIINIGSLIGQKNQEQLIGVFKNVKNQIPKAKLVILGEGVLERHLRKVVSKFGLEGDVYFLGWQKNPFKFIAKSKVFALPSLWEGFGIVILEAMACGVPVVAFDCPFGPKEILAPQLDINKPVKNIVFASCGVLVPLPNESHDSKEDYFAKALMRVIQDQSLRNIIIKSAEKRVHDFNRERFLKGYQFLWE